MHNALVIFVNPRRMQSLNDKTIKKIFINDDTLTFETDQGDVSFGVSGDCCSHSYFHDFIGVENIIGKKVIITESVPMDVPEKDQPEYD